MSEAMTLDAYAVQTAPTTLTLQRLLPGPIERVWDYLTKSELRRQWLASGDMELTVGAPVELVWRNGELSRERTERPAGMPEENRLQTEITKVDPPRLLAFNFGGGEVTFELAPQGQQVLLTVTQERLADRASMLKIGAGWHSHLDILGDVLAGRDPAPIWPAWSKLHAEYGQRLV